MTPSLASSPLSLASSPYQRHPTEPLTLGVEPIEPVAPPLRSRSLSFRRRGPKGELSRASKGGSCKGSPVCVLTYRAVTELRVRVPNVLSIGFVYCVCRVRANVCRF